METCDHCRFWVSATEECRRYAPRPLHWQFYGLCLALARNDAEAEEVVGESAGKADWPTTHAYEWCGEFEKRKAD
jgi:hypothetical protein